MTDVAVELRELEVCLVSQKLSEVTETEVVSVSTIENVLCRIVGVYGQTTIVVLCDTDLLQAGESADGHKNISTTQRYAHLEIEDIRAAQEPTFEDDENGTEERDPQDEQAA